MSAAMSVSKTGLVVAALIGGWHLCWATLVAAGFAQPVIDFVFWMHFIKPVYAVERFEIGRAAMLLVVTSALGFVIGAAFAIVWNGLHRERGSLHASRQRAG